MGILSAGMAFTRFRVISAVSPEILRQTLEALKKKSFKEIDQGTEERSFGWVCFDNFLDAEWRVAPPEKGEFLAFALRLDTRRIAPAVMRKYFRLALEREMQEQNRAGRKFISKERKKELREEVEHRLMARTLPIPAVFDVVWNPRDNIIYFWSIRDKMIELFMEYFNISFDLRLERLTPYVRARELVDPACAAAMETVEPADFTK